VKCEDVLPRLEDCSDAELESAVSVGIREHLLACRTCSEAYAELEREQGLYRSYATALNHDLNAGPEMWQEIQAAISPKRMPAPFHRWSLLEKFESLLPAGRFARYALFATAVACVSISGTLLALRLLAPRPEISVGMTASPFPQNSLESALHSVQRAELEYVQAIGLLSEIVERQKGMLEPAKRAEMEKHLKSLDEEIIRARQAFHSHPLDTELGIYMLTAYREKVELLQELATI
jgi:hypothetical protein